MNLSDELSPAPDPACLTLALRRHRRLRHIVRTGATASIVLGACIILRPQRLQPQPTTAEGLGQLAPSRPVTVTREEFLDSFTDESVALVVWPDGREQLFIRQ